MQKKLLRKPGNPQAAAGEEAGTSGAGPRRARVRNRLLVSVALCAVAVLGAGTPALVTASGDVSDSQELVDLAGLNQQAIGLSHALADERDGMVEYIGAGRTSRGGAGVSESLRSRVDRQAADVRRHPSASPQLKKLLAALPGIRQQAINGRGTALESHQDYGKVLDELQRISGSVARGLPGRAENPTADALPDLGRAAEQASAVRGLLSGALAGRGSQPTLTAEAQRAHVRQEAALAEFDANASPDSRDTVDKTVTGTDVTTAERYLARLTDRPRLQPSDRLLNRSAFEKSVSARIDRMRGVQASFAADEVKRLEEIRDDDVTSLELLIALVGLCLLGGAGAGVQAARSMARPLAVLRRGSQRLAQDPVHEEPVKYTGKNDEFADVVRAMNELRSTAAALHERATEAEADAAFLVDSKDRLVAERDRLRSEYRELQRLLEEAEERAESMSGAAHGTFVNLAMRTLGLVERQLGVIEGLEEKETDPDRLSTLFKLDHLATRMRRHGENLLLLAGDEHGNSHHSGPVALLDVLRAAVSEVERYERVELGSLPPHLQVSGHAADDVSHLTAELLDNATSFSPPESRVQLSGWLLESGEVMLSVQDEGIGLSTERLAEFNERLQDPEGQEPPRTGSGSGDAAMGMGLYVVARIAARHGLRVQLRAQQQGGVAAVVTLPSALLPSRPAPVSARSAPSSGEGAEAAPVLPGSAAEANANALPSRRRIPQQQSGESSGDPLIDAAEQTVREAGVEGTDQPVTPHRTEEPDGPPAGESAAAVPDFAGPPADGEAHGDPASGAGSATPEEYRHPYGDGTPAADTDAPGAADEGDAAAEEPTGAWPAITDKGLPKRRPKQVDVEPAAGRPRKGGANAEELRRRLGGFQQGALSGRRDFAAENSEEPAGESAAEEHVHDQSGAQVNGGTAEEARK